MCLFLIKIIGFGLWDVFFLFLFLGSFRHMFLFSIVFFLYSSKSLIYLQAFRKILILSKNFSDSCRCWPDFHRFWPNWPENVFSRDLLPITRPINRRFVRFLEPCQNIFNRNICPLGLFIILMLNSFTRLMIVFFIQFQLSYNNVLTA